MRQMWNILEDIGPVRSGVKLTQYSTIRTSYQQSNTVVVVWWSGAALLLQDLGDLPYLMEPWILLSTRKILKENVWPSVCDLKLKCSWVMQQDNDPKHTIKSTSEWLKRNNIKILKWPSQSADLNPIEMLWHYLKRAVDARKPSNVAESKQFCQEEWAKIPPQRCKRWIASYRKRLIGVVVAKDGTTSYYVQGGNYFFC